MVSQETSSEGSWDLEAVFEVDDYLYFYGDRLTDQRSDAEVDGLVQLLDLAAPMRILDLACGFGRHANRLAALGHLVVGIDYMPGFLEIARAHGQRMGVEVDYRQGDMRSLNICADFDRVLILFTTFGYFSDEENARVLANASRALKPGGLLGLDMLNRDMALKNLVPAQVDEKEGNLMINRMSFDPVSGRWINRRIVIRDGVRRDKPFSIRLYNLSEIRQLLAEAGLELETVCADWRGQALSPDSRAMAIVARKLG
jgi:SAM-dependent methyltransferase